MWVLFGDYHHFFNLFFRLQLSSTIPAAPKIFGREAFVSQAVSLFQTVRPAYLAILGGPGMGKTSTALQIVHHKELKDVFSKISFVPCDAAVTYHLLVTSILQVL